jgi:hypothetical protein
MKSAHCDIVCCGSDFVDAQSGNVFDKRAIQNNAILKSNIFESAFPEYYQFIRTVWGKVFSRKILDGIDLTAISIEQPSNGQDIYFSFEAYSRAKRVGILAGTSHKYYTNQGIKSVYHQWLPWREKSYSPLYNKGREFLIAKCGSVSPRNDDFLLLVYLSSLIDTLPVLLGAANSAPEKIDALYEMLYCDNAKTLAARENLGALIGDRNAIQHRNKLFSDAAEWMLSREDVPYEQAEKFCELGEFICAACEDASGWVLFKKLLVQFYIDQNRADDAKSLIAELMKLLPQDKEIQRFAEEIGVEIAIIPPPVNIYQKQ